jgi:hypothetical protein
MFAWKVVIEFLNWKTGDSPFWVSRKRQTRKSKINRNLYPCKPYDKEFNHFYLPIKISLIFLKEVEHKIRDLLFTWATVYS